MLATLCLAVPASLYAEALSPDRVAVVDDSVWPHVTWAAFDQDKVVSFGDYQYSIYWNAHRVLTVVRRDLQSDETQTVTLDEYVLAEGMPLRQQRNGHRNTVLGISPHDGRLHMAWDHHVNDLNYTRTRSGFLTEPPAEMTADDFEPRQPIMDGAPQRVTYPRFLNDHEDNLYFVYRSGASGGGNTVFFEYDATAGNWSMITDRLFGLRGTYAPWNDSQSRNAYMHDLLFDGEGRLHITWVYREWAGSWASNHDLHYAYSDDQGRTWKNNAGELIADTRKGEEITIDSPGIVVRDIPVFSWLMNQGSMALDSNNNPHVATFHREEPYEPENLEHSPPAEVRRQLTYYHYWRDNDGEWHRGDPLPMLGGGRPQIVSAPDDTLIIYFRTREGFFAYVARSGDNWKQWERVRLTGPEFTGNNTSISKPDRRRFHEEKILSFTADSNPEEGRGYAFLDFSLERIIKAE